MQKAVTIHQYWCEQQQQDYLHIMQAVDNIGAASLALASQGAHAYQQFIDARESFTYLMTEVMKRYRYIEE
jgi:hypothetical protein